MNEQIQEVLGEKIIIEKHQAENGKLHSSVRWLNRELAEAKADSERLDKLDAFEPSYLVDLIELYCVKGDKTVREMLDWIYRNVKEQDHE